MTKWKDPIAEAKREGWNEAISMAARLAKSQPVILRNPVQRHAYEAARYDISASIRSLHKPTEESET